MKEYKENSLSIEELDKELEGLIESMRKMKHWRKR